MTVLSAAPYLESDLVIVDGKIVKSRWTDRQLGIDGMLGSHYYVDTAKFLELERKLDALIAVVTESCDRLDKITRGER